MTSILTQSLTNEKSPAEMYDDFTLGPIYFIRLSDKWEEEVLFPMYNKSDDSGFVEACDSFLSDTLILYFLSFGI